MKHHQVSSHFLPKDVGSSFFQLMLGDLEFFVTYLSVHYPFTESEIQQYWDVLSPGTAHYPVYLPDTETAYSSALGLCFNQNIRWTDALRNRWSIGFDNPLQGCYIGLGTSPVEYNETEKYRSLLPLNLYEHWWAGEMLVMDSYQQQGLLDVYLDRRYPSDGMSPEMKVEHDYPKLSFENFQKLYGEIGRWIVYNRSIWYNTLFYELSDKDVFRLLRLRRYQISAHENNQI